MSFSSDAIVKREIVSKVGTRINGFKLRIYPESSNKDQRPFSEEGLTFGYKNILYGSCDGCWYKKDEEWIDGYDGKKYKPEPVLAIEGTDALNRGSSGDAQLQRFHHALGAVKNGLIGVYYLRKGKEEIRPDLFGMAYYASKYERGVYIVTDDLNDVKEILLCYDKKYSLNKFLDYKLKFMKSIYLDFFEKRYGGSLKKFAEKRSIILKDNYLIKYSARMERNFTICGLK